ncbi:MAG: hypothetical protein GX601_14215, partial [Anaerolineales bacterium]|nr:hypothetical protein [Anaerolineales bacterium]
YYEAISGAWLRIFRLALPIAASLIVVPLLASLFVSKLHGVDTLSDVHTYLHRSIFGLRGRQPIVQIEKGQVTGQRKSLVARLGGPGNLLIYNDSAAVLEQGGRLTRVAKPGFRALRRYERVWDVVDLRPQYWVVSVEAMTRDGIAVTCEADITFKVDGGGQDSTGQMLHPYQERAVFKAATATWVRGPKDAPWKLTWAARVARQAEETLREIISEYRLDGLVGVSWSGGEHPRQVVQKRLRDRLEQSVAELGAQVDKVELGEFELDPRVAQQWVKAWQAVWQREATLEQAEGEARMAQLEMAQTQARLEVILTLAQSLQHLVSVEGQASSYHIAMRLVETLRWMSFDPLTRASMSPRALTSLKQLQESLNHERNGRAESDRKQAPPEE